MHNFVVVFLCKTHNQSVELYSFLSSAVIFYTRKKAREYRMLFCVILIIVYIPDQQMAVSNLQAPFFFQIFSKHTCKKRASGRFSNEKSRIRPKRYYFFILPL